MKLVLADALITGDGPILRDAAVLVRDDGAIEAFGKANEVVPTAGVGIARETVRGVVMPGLVNAHTHLELSAMRGRVRGGKGFFPWLDDLLGVRAELEDDETQVAIDAAVKSLDACGTVAVGEVTNTLAAASALVSAGMAGSLFHEVFGVLRAPTMARVAQLTAFAAGRLKGLAGSELDYAPSPHTLYTTHPDAVKELLRLARERGARASIHLLEHGDERLAIERGEGAAPDWLTRRVFKTVPHAASDGFVWPKTPVLDYAASLGVLSPDVVLVHLTDARREELDRIASAGSSVVLCPRSNVTIEDRVPPVLDMLAAGLAPALGTDSLASCASLDVLQDAAVLAECTPALPAATLLRMATWNGALALGRRDLGRVAKDAMPGLLAIEGELAGLDPAEFVLRHRAAPRRWIARRMPPRSKRAG